MSLRISIPSSSTSDNDVAYSPTMPPCPTTPPQWSKPLDPYFAPQKTVTGPDTPMDQDTTPVPPNAPRKAARPPQTPINQRVKCGVMKPLPPRRLADVLDSSMDDEPCLVPVPDFLEPRFPPRLSRDWS